MPICMEKGLQKTTLLYSGETASVIAVATSTHSVAQDSNQEGEVTDLVEEVRKLVEERDLAVERLKAARDEVAELKANAVSVEITQDPIDMDEFGDLYAETYTRLSRPKKYNLLITHKGTTATFQGWEYTLRKPADD